MLLRYYSRADIRLSMAHLAYMVFLRKIDDIYVVMSESEPEPKLKHCAYLPIDDSSDDEPFDQNGYYPFCFGKLNDKQRWTEASGPFETREDAFKEVIRCALRRDALSLPRTGDTELYQYLSLVLPTNEQGLIEIKPEHTDMILDYVDTRVQLSKVTYEKAVKECAWNNEYFMYALRHAADGEEKWLKNDDPSEST